MADLELELSDGLTVITGESGSGKSVVVEALSQLLGGALKVCRFPLEWPVRHPRHRT